MVEYPTIKAFNPDLLVNAVQVELADDATAGASTLTVSSITGIGVGDYLLVGEFGLETAEIVRVSTGVAPSGTTITLNANAVYGHGRSTVIYRIDRNQVEFSRSTTLTGGKSVLATVDIQCDNLYTVYEDTTNSTGFGWYRFKNSGDTTYSNYSESYPYAGYGEQTVKKILDSALLILGIVNELGEPTFTPSLSRMAGVIAINDCQQELKELRHRWSYLTNFNYAIAELSTGQDTYSLPSDIAEEEGHLSIRAARISAQKDLKFIDKSQMDVRRENVVKTTLGSAISSTGDVTVTLADSSDFDDSGSILVVDDDGAGFDTITYTGNNRSTNVLSGVTGIAETHASGAIVLQGATLDKPVVYTVFEDSIVLDPIPSASWNLHNLIIDAYLDPTVINDLADEAEFPATVIKPYVAWRYAMILDGGQGSRIATLYGLYNAEKDKILRKEATGHYTKLQPNRRPDVTSNFTLRQTSSDTND